MENLIRIQFELPKEKVRELEIIMKKAGISTKKDLLNNALTLFEWAVSEKELGNSIVSIDERNNRLKELVMPSLSSIKPERTNADLNGGSVPAESEGVH